MADMELVLIVKRGRDAVAQWREENPTTTMDLSEAYMSHTRLPQVDLSASDLRNSDFMGAMLRRANFSRSYMNPCHLYRADLREANLSSTLLSGANLRGADLRKANLEGANLDRAILSDCNFEGANLKGANLSRTNIDRANMKDADLSGAYFGGSRIKRSNFDNTNLTESDLFEANIDTVTFDGSDLSGSILGYTVFQNCDLSNVSNLDSIRHDAPSTLGVDSLLKSSNLPEEFLRGIGVTDSFIELSKSIERTVASPECYISCTSEHKEYAIKLQEELRSKGVVCWLFSEDSRGNALVDRRSTSEEEEIERWVRHYDKLIVVTTEESFSNEVIRNDVVSGKEKQMSEDSWVLYLVSPNEEIMESRNRFIRTLRSENTVFVIDMESEASNSNLDKLVEVMNSELTHEDSIPSLTE
ncbi:MAG: pentapeptide repeat-containing protein [SAR202 cluster bacterium]|nr:pentapeptide repeat-containing protein [SAR202 cluster bacterium]|tara:strand:- start:28 stop:1272 length:1245 start_codon:yes stop_codon:yes gene_type:complete